MRQGPHAKRGRGRGNRRSNVPNRNQTFDSNGPDVRIRGNAHQVYEKYLSLARDATTSGDRVLAESCYQHAEHYFRILKTFADEADDGRARQAGGQRAAGEAGSESQPELRNSAEDIAAGEQPATIVDRQAEEADAPLIEAMKAKPADAGGADVVPENAAEAIGNETDQLPAFVSQPALAEHDGDLAPKPRRRRTLRPVRKADDDGGDVKTPAAAD